MESVTYQCIHCNDYFRSNEDLIRHGDEGCAIMGIQEKDLTTENDLTIRRPLTTLEELFTRIESLNVKLATDNVTSSSLPETLSVLQDTYREVGVYIVHHKELLK